ncbi:BTB/POZ domain-containing protein 6-like [Saccostrea echinata]|uniref:BTB/POZ domain-containing protein 6-like n=1 Tax=Saccostrea echinata TaxID=191078 RepID=UPI002A8155D1|nr:BTB/POZ domain-containing protein 6-like [Saccostrea echinata]
MNTKGFDGHTPETKCHVQTPQEQSERETYSKEVRNQEWQCDKSVVECVHYMLTNQIACDVSIFIGPEKFEVKAHRFILIARSPVFFDKLRSCTASEEFRYKVNVPNVEVDTFQRFIRYLYTDEVDINLESAMSLLPVARRFRVNHLVQLCLRLLNDEVDAHNVSYLLDQAILSHAITMRDRAMEIINKSTRECLKSEAFCNICSEALEYILKSDDLNISEQELYECCLKWSSTQCLKKSLEITDENIRDQLGECIHQIRFTLMPKDYFQHEIFGRKILSDEEKTDIIECITDGSPKNSVLKFNRNLRKTTEYFRVLRFEKLDKKLKEHTGRPDAIMFETSKPLWFHGVALFGSYIEQTINVHLEISDSRNNVIRALGLAFQSTESEEMYDVLLPIPFETIAGARYNVVVIAVGKFRHMYRGVEGKRELTFKDTQITFFESGNSSNGTTVSEGQIPGFLLS